MLERHALVIEDQELLRGLLTKSLEQHGFSVAAVRSPQEALAALESRGPDVLVLDGRIRGIDALAWLAHVRPLLPGVPFMVLTGLGSRMGELPHALAPCTSVMLPLDGPAFAAVVNRCLAEAEAHGGASLAHGFDLELHDAIAEFGRVLTSVETLTRLGGGVPAIQTRIFTHVLRSALRRARGRGPVRVRCALSGSRMSCEVGIAQGDSPWSVEDSEFALVRKSLAALELSPDGNRLSFALVRGSAEAA